MGIEQAITAKAERLARMEGVGCFGAGGTTTVIAAEMGKLGLGGSGGIP